MSSTETKKRPQELLAWPFDAELLLRKRRPLRRQLLAQEEKRTPVKIAILGGSTTNDVQDFIELFLLAEGLEPTFYASEYGKYWEDGVFGNPELDAFGPDLIYVHTTFRNIRQWPAPDMDAAAAGALLDAQVNHFTQLWEALRQRYGCPVIQNNFERPDTRLLGSMDIVDYRGKSSFVLRLNEALYEYARTHDRFYVHDIDYLSAKVGLDEWHDEQYWCLFKCAFAMKAVPRFAYSLTRIIKAMYGKNRKAVALDLDNTLWGGVVGDDGPEKISIGAETADGEVYLRVQEYMRELKGIGVLLAVNSKNDEENALAGLRREDGALRPEDFTAICANWESKDRNMLRLAQQINIGVDSIVFVDDNPAEREMVRSQLPQVPVLEFDTPFASVRNLDDAGFFEVISLTADDLKRSEMYKANASRRELETHFTDYGEYLKSLEMKADIRRVDPVSVRRVAQLTNKTNQFNLTTKRCTEAQIEEFSRDEDMVCLSGRLEDKFGDNGIVSVVIGRKTEDIMDLEVWLMSCRVLKREMEYAMFDRLMEEIRPMGIRLLRGHYYPTAKNRMVAGFYEDLGFTKTREEEDGTTEWEFETAGYTPKNTVITYI